MKRSFVDAKIDETIAFFNNQGFQLPPWADWSPEEWTKRVASAAEIIHNGLGWDLTGFGYANFEEIGLTLFTLRNGLRSAQLKPYCEKIMHVRKNQLTPYHYHANKIEDIIVRGGEGNFCLALLPTDEIRKPIYGAKVTVEIDGIYQTFEAEEKIVLKKGQSICLQPYLYHKFWAEEADCMVGEVSTVNDDASDNYFLEALGRFSELESDEVAKYVLCNEYPTV